MANRLEGETSPYLLQHKGNPVDWHPWGEEAFERARTQDKPIFVSIGYAACHWCHVMAHESFENPEIAALMNELLVNVKVDREERPDVDSIYMNAIHVMGEGGGWPLSAFCDANGRPFFVGTYFPPTDRYGRPGFPTVVRTLATLYRDQRDKVEQNASAVLDGIRQLDTVLRRGAGQMDVSSLDDNLLITSGRKLAQSCDLTFGGFGSQPKFPSSPSHDLLARAGRLKFGQPAREAFLLQANKMAAGGIYDHLGGGFARYSVDNRWLVPHFEKMLYDNAQLLGIYGDVYAMTRDGGCVRVIEETIGWLEREMSDQSGGLYASQDADSEGEEGKFYVWTPDDIRDVLGPADAIFFSEAYGVTERGNFEHGTTVLSRITARGSDSDEAALAGMRGRLFESRRNRVPPDTDTKILAGWNALVVTGLVRAWEATGTEAALKLALRVGQFLATEMMHDGNTRIWRVFKDGRTKLDGTLDDYAMTAEAMFRLAEATLDSMWWERGTSLMASITERFYEELDGVGVLYMTPTDDSNKLVVRPESHQDNAIPAGASVAIDCLVRLAVIEDDFRSLEVAERYLASRAPQVGKHPMMAARLLSALDRYLNGVEVVVSEGEGKADLLTAARRAYAPTLMIAGPWAAPSLLEGKAGEGGSARAYVCRGQTCSPPVASADELATLLA